MEVLIKRLIAWGMLFYSASALAAWEYKEFHDDFDGTTSYVLQAESSIAVEGADGEIRHPFIQLRCDEDGGQPYWRVEWYAIIDTTLSSNRFVGVIEDIRMQVRVDGKEDRRAVWSWDRDESLQSISTYRVPAIVRSLRDANELKLRIAGLYGRTHDATFNVAGLEQGLEQLRTHCKRL